MHVDAQLVQAGDGLEADIGLDVGGGAMGVDGQSHMHAFGGESFGDPRPCPVAMPVIDDSAGTGPGLAGQNVGGMNHMGGLALKRRQVWTRSGSEDYSIRPLALRAWRVSLHCGDG